MIDPDASEPIRSNRVGSFPWSVLHDRHPVLLQQVRAAHPYPPQQQAALDALEREIAGVIEPLTDSAADAATWAEWARPYLGRTWYDVPFLWAENYFYRKLLAAVGYLEPGPWRGIDPFAPLKAAELAGKLVDEELAALDELALLSPVERIDALVLAALWGNRADLGFLIHATGPEDGRGDRLVADDRAGLHRLLGQGPPGMVVVVADNAGRELLPDLILIDQLLVSGLATAVVLHLKPSPYFVSDATTADVLAVLARLSIGPGSASNSVLASNPGSASGPAAGPGSAQQIGQRLRTAIETGRLVLRADPFSVAPFGYRQMPDRLRAEFATAKLTVMKGDLNYRRLLGDQNWPATTPFDDLTEYFPGPVVALRTLKSDVVAGLDPATLAELEATGSPWRTTGAYGLIQFKP